MSPQPTTSIPRLHPQKRKHSDISGPNLDRPAKRSRHSDDGGGDDHHHEETNLWTTVKKYLENPTRHPQPRVSCPICMVPIAIRGVPALEPDPWKLSAGMHQVVGTVLPCAHMICQRCINAHLRAQQELSPGGAKTCPCCRADLRFTCGELIPPQRLPVASGETADLVPPTRPELEPGLGHRFPEDCYSCTSRAGEEYIDVCLGFVGGVVHGAEHPRGEFTPAWDGLVASSLDLFWRYLSEQRWVPSWRNGRVPITPFRVSFADDALVVDALDEFLYPDGDSLVWSRRGELLWRVPHRRGGAMF